MGAYAGGKKIATDSLSRAMDIKNPKSWPGSGSSVYNLVNGAAWAISNPGDITTTNEYFEWSGGNTGYINMEDTGEQGNFSLSVWYYNFSSGGDSRHSILRNFWEVVGTSIQFWSYSFANDYWRSAGSGSVPYDTWTHITTTWDGSVIRHYINGELYWTDSNSSSGNCQNLYQIGGYSGRRMHGRIAHLTVNNKTLSAAEVRENYLTLKSRFQS